MACTTLTTGITLDCEYGAGGIDSMWIISPSADNVFKYSIANDGATPPIDYPGVIDTFMLNTIAVDSTDLHKFDLGRESAKLTETDVIDHVNGTLFYEKTLTIIFGKLDIAKRNTIKLLATNPNLIVFVKDNNGTYWELGVDGGAMVTVSTKDSGQKYGDANGYSLTISAKSMNPMFECENSNMVTLTA